MTDKTQKIQKLKQEILGLLGNLESDDENTGSQEDEIQKPNETEKALILEKPEKKKRELTEKQKEALKKGQEKRLELARHRKEQADIIAEQKKKEFEDKLVKKALSVKKKQLKEQMLLNSLSDDEDLPIEKVKKIIKDVKTETKAQTEGAKPPSQPRKPTANGIAKEEEKKYNSMNLQTLPEVKTGVQPIDKPVMKFKFF